MSLRLLLFGPPGSGKSALLGALAQASSSQAAVLHGKLVDDTGRLAALNEVAAAGALPATTHEIDTFPVHFESEGQSPVAANLLDTGGVIAQEYLAGRLPLVPANRLLPHELLDADTIIITLPAAGGSEAAQLKTFQDFLTLLQDARSRHAEVADLPVYLVLTKCDQLAKPEDTFSRWVQRIEEAKRRLHERFAAFMAQKPTVAAFGTISLHLWATAIRRPPLSDRPAPAAEPYGVAELFRQCFAEARAFDQREHRAGRRLEFAVGSLGVLVVLMVLLGALFVLTQPNTELLDLAQRAQATIPERDASDKLPMRGDLERRLRELDEIEHHPLYSELPSATRAEIESASAVIASYVQAKKAFNEQVKPPYQAKNEKEFDELERGAQGFALPTSTDVDWDNTSLAKQLAKIRAEYASVRSAVTDEVQWVRKQTAEGAELNAEGNRLPPELASLDADKKKEGRKHAEAWFAAYLKYTNRPSFRMPGDQPVKGTAAFTYADLRKFQAVRDARREWDRVKGDLDKTYKYVSMFVVH
jgi:GTPase SAR1 family protein